MLTRPKSRLVFLASSRTRIVVVRPIGNLTAADLIGRLFTAYATIAAPWTYDRMYDFRRFEGDLSQADMEEIAHQWTLLCNAQKYDARVAILSNQTQLKVHAKATASLYPNETRLLFKDFYEAISWLRVFGKCQSLYGQRAPSLPPTALATDHQASERRHLTDGLVSRKGYGMTLRPPLHGVQINRNRAGATPQVQSSPV